MHSKDYIEYHLISKKGEGTFSEVLKAQSIDTGNFVAIKCMKSTFASLEQVNSLREVQALRRLSPHSQIINDELSGRLALVFELMDKNLYEWTRGRRVPPPEEEVKEYMRDLLVGIDHIHRNGIFHRDIKPENVLVSESSLKIADFGSCKGIYSKQPYTEYISTRWYRSPECLMTDGYYSFKMDIWGIGCVFFEVLALFPLFPGKNELDQINKIHNILGTPSEAMQKMFQSKASHMEINFPYKKGTGFEKMIAHASPMAKDLISEMLKYDETERYTAKQALNHPYFYKEPPKVIKILPIIKSTKNALKKSVAFPPIRKKHIPLSKAPKKTYTTLKNHYHMMKKKKLQKNPLHGDLQAQKDIFLSCITDKLLIIEY